MDTAGKLSRLTGGLDLAGNRPLSRSFLASPLCVCLCLCLCFLCLSCASDWPEVHCVWTWEISAARNS